MSTFYSIQRGSLAILDIQLSGYGSQYIRRTASCTYVAIHPFINVKHMNTCTHEQSCVSHATFKEGRTEKKKIYTKEKSSLEILKIQPHLLREYQRTTKVKILLGFSLKPLHCSTPSH